jgi:hypothetical protein
MSGYLVAVLSHDTRSKWTTRKGVSVSITSKYKSVTCGFVEIALLLEKQAY